MVVHANDKIPILSFFTNISRGAYLVSIPNVSSCVTDSYLYCCEPREVRGANPGMKKWRRGKGTMLTASFLRSALSWPGNLRQVVTPDMVRDTRWFRSP